MRIGTAITVLLASREDDLAARFARSHCQAGVRLLTPEDLSAPGWHFATRDHENRAVIGGKPIAVEHIRAAIAFLPAVRVRDIASLIAPEDRVYAAAEMTAFLAAWLAALDARAVNAPSPVCLTGTAPTHRVLRDYAQRSGLDLAVSPAETKAVSCVNGVPITEDDRFFEPAAAVCEIAGESLARIHLTTSGRGCALAGYDHRVDLDHPRVAVAVLAACQ